MMPATFANANNSLDSDLITMPTKLDSRSSKTQKRMYGPNGLAYKFSAKDSLPNILEGLEDSVEWSCSITGAQGADFDFVIYDFIDYFSRSSSTMMQTNDGSAISMPTKTNSRSSETQRRMYGPGGRASKLLSKDSVTQYLMSTNDSGFHDVIDHISYHPRAA